METVSATKTSGVKRSTINISLVLIPEATASTLMSVYDVFNLYHGIVRGENPFSVSLVSDTLAPVATASAIRFTPQATYADTLRSDVIIVPALILPDGDWQNGRYSQLVEWLKSQYQHGAILCSACSGIFPLMETGLLDNMPVTCHWAYENALRKGYPSANIRIEKTLIIAGEDNRLIMSGASASWHDLVLYLINHYAGPAAANAVAKFCLLNWHPEGQAPYSRFEENIQHGDAVVVKAQAWIQQNWMKPNPVEQMMVASGLAERSFKRRFKNATGLSPMDYVQHIRVEQAKQLLEISSKSVDEIALRIGYEDPAFFRKLFKRITTLTPSAYRMKFRTPYNVVGSQAAKRVY